ncbi:MAG TPA: polyphosphate kinase 1 [Bryobacteraceae bacterium]
MATKPLKVAAKRNASKRAVTAPAPAESEPAINLLDPGLYVNRELSLLAFQRRVLEEACDESNPLLERVKFLAILGSNLDEFFMVRVAGLVAQLDAGAVETGPDGLSPAAQLAAIRPLIKQLLDDAHRCLTEQLLPALGVHGIRIHEYAELSERQVTAVDRYFAETIFPVLTPLAFDPGRPFPHISNLSLNLAVLIRDHEGEEKFARIKVPDSLPQLIPTDAQPRHRTKRFNHQHASEFIFIEKLIAANLSRLFPGMDIIEVHPFHVTRDADIEIKELEAEDLLETIEEGVRQRKFGDVVRVMVDTGMPPHILEILMSNLEIDSSDVYRVSGSLSLKRMMTLGSLDCPELKEAPFVPSPPPAIVQNDDEDMFAILRKQDVVLHHPFESFQPVVDFLRKAARDPNVLAIKTVLYRVGRNSPVVEALLEAVEYGKQVAVLVELKARFDEESNIEWARALEKVGAHVVYGLVGLKCHCKVAMVVRREDDGRTMRRYLHFSSGNYNSFTAHLYTDVGMFTTDETLADDVTDLFNVLTGYSRKSDYKELLVSPVNLRTRFEAMIDREIEHQKAGRAGLLIFKMNALTDPPMVRALYRASMAGVKCELLVRGNCALRPGVKGVSDNITVTSIVGRFLEHSRLYYFRNGGDEEIYSGSADLAPRNLYRRVEVLYPMKNRKIVQRLKNEVLATYQGDNVKARRMNSDGTYTRVKTPTGAKRLSAQESLLKKCHEQQQQSQS